MVPSDQSKRVTLTKVVKYHFKTLKGLISRLTDQGKEYHYEAGAQKKINGLQIGDLWQLGVG